MVLWSSSWHQAHIVIQAYTYNHTIKHTHTSIHIKPCNDVAHRYMKHSHEKLYLSLVSSPAAGAVQQIDCQIPGLCACHPCSLPDWWLDPWSLHCACRLAVHQVDFQNAGVRACQRSRAGWLSDPCKLQERWLDQVASLLSAPATSAINRIDFQTVGLCARPWYSLPS